MSAAVDEVFTALGDPTRRTLLRTVASRGPVTATELAQGLPITRQAVAKHLAVLGSAGLVAATRRGRESRYEVRPAALREVTAWVDEVGADWDRRLDRLRHHLGGS